MALIKLKDFDPNYKDTFGGEDIHGFDVYSDTSNDKIGSIVDVLVDNDGHFRYLVVDLGFWIFGKKVLLPVGRSRIDYNARRVHALGMTRQQAENLPEFHENMQPDYDYEEKVRGVYRPPSTDTLGVAATPSVVPDAAAGMAATTPAPVDMTPAVGMYDRNNYNYQQEPYLYNMNEQDHQVLRLYEERLIANKNRVKTGEVAVGKRVETETARVAVPIEKERVIIERNTPTNAGTVVNPGEADFQSGEVARIEVYEETPNIRKEAFVREEVRVRKEVDRDTVEAQDTIRREELDINTEGTPVVDEGTDLRATDRI
jgi:uncharacterized protein (TIGR02271 family)